MSDSTSYVICPNCSETAVFDIKIGFKCQECLMELDVEEYFAVHFARDFVFKDVKIKTKVYDKNDHFLGEYFVGKDGILSFSVERQVDMGPIIRRAVDLGLNLNVCITGDQAYFSKCLICGASLSYDPHQFNDPSIGCHKGNHVYYYQNPLSWVAAVLNQQYRHWNFYYNDDEKCVYVSKTVPVPAEKTTFYERLCGVKKTATTKTIKLTQVIVVATDQKTLAVWIPKSLQKEVGSLNETLNYHKVRNTKSVLINN